MEARRNVAVAGSILFALLLGTSSSHAQDLKKLATDLSTRIHAAKHERVTVVDFVDLDKKPTKLGKYLAQQLQATLAEPEYKIDVVDQSHLGQLMEQMEKLSEGLIDKATGQQLGKMAGTEVLIVGSVMPSSLTVRLDIKAIDLQTAKLIMGGSASLPRLGVVDRLASASGEGEEESSDDHGAKGKVVHGGSNKASSHTPMRSRRDQGVDFDLDGCSLSGDSLTCAVTVTSGGRDRWLAVSFRSRAWNTTGDEYDPGDVTIANLSRERDCAPKQILKDVPTHMAVTFPKFGSDNSMVERFRIYWEESEYCPYGDWRPVEFEKIAISEGSDFASPHGSSHSGSSHGGSQNSSGGKGKSSLLDHLKDRAMDILDKTIDKKTRKLTDDDQDDDNPAPKSKKKAAKPPQL
jgi:hypothetical protein